MLLNKHPKVSAKFIEYGTAGFRTRADDLDHVVYRMGILAVLRSKVKKATIGVMITASHNPEEDNGVKLVDPAGEMLEESWEAVATKLANINEDGLEDEIKKIIHDFNIEMNHPSNIVLARDTRSSGPALSQALIDGIKKLESEYQDYGVLSTPQLHYMVKCINTQGNYGEPTADGYYNKLSQAFIQLNSSVGSADGISLYLDGANGVGALKMKELMKHIGHLIEVSIFNDGSNGKLNYQCGADYVKIQQKAPMGVPTEKNRRCISFDGDADRVVYYYFDSAETFHLLDGDKIATLIAEFVSDLTNQAGISIDVGVVQTAYANGASTKYITDVAKVPVACVPTGVKHLHHKAQEFEVGVYFEANGHGTVLFKDSVVEKLRQVLSQENSNENKQAAKDFLSFINLTNQTVGDAISDMLLVETILNRKNRSIATWNELYADLPNRQLKIKVKDRRAIVTTNAEREVVQPEGLQAAINNIVAKFDSGRSFVRPSGTEDVVRVYAEANSRENADQLAYEVGCVVYDMAGGEREKPSKPNH